MKAKVAVLGASGFAGAELLLVDDTPDNVEAARAAGWRAIQWTGRDRLADLISDLGGAA